MAPYLSSVSPSLHHAHSESRLLARRQNGSAVVKLPGLKPCSSVARGLRQLDRKDYSPSLQGRSDSGCSAAPQPLAAAAGKENRSSLPLLPLAEMGRGMVRQLTPPHDRLRPAKRSRSSAAAYSDEKVSGQRNETEIDKVADSKLLSKSQSQSSSQSSGATTPFHNGSLSLDNDVEQVLQTALDLNSRTGTQKSSQDLCGTSEIEDHLAELLQMHDAEEKPPPRAKKHRARVSDRCCDKENRIRRKGTGFVHLNSTPDAAADRRVSIVDDHGDNANNIRRKGTGFVHLPKVNMRHARINDQHGDNENRLHRKGTGFIHLRSQSLTCDHRARISDPHGDNENNIVRKGTGFVDLSSLPKEPPAVWFPDMTGGNVNRIQRKGTGYVFLNHISPRVRIADNHGDNENCIQRKGTGFVDLSDCKYDMLPSPPSLCAGGTFESPGSCQNASDTGVAACERLHREACEEQLSLVEIF